MHRLQEMVRLQRLGNSVRVVARRLQMGRDTVRAYAKALKEAGLLDGDPTALPEPEALQAAVTAQRPAKVSRQQTSSLERWKARIAAMAGKGAGPQAIYDCLRTQQPDFMGSLSAVKRLCLRLVKERGVRPEDVAIPVDTAAGEVAQVDFGYAGVLYDAERHVARKAWVFVMVLGHSRHLWADIVFDQKIETWLDLHVRAFAALGGVPKVIVPDNLKAAVVRAAFGVDGEAQLNRSYCELARHYGFQIDPTPPRSPEKKGKVESGVKYLGRNFFLPRDHQEVQAARADLAVWLEKVAGQRVHGSTGRRPAEVFEQEERQALLPLPAVPYELVVWKRAQLHTDCHVQIDGGFYSAPFRLLHQDLWCRCTARSITTYHDDQRLRTHPRVARGKRSTFEDDLPEHRREARHRSRPYWEERADRIGPEVGQYVRAVFDSDDVLLKLRPVQAAVRHLETFPKERARAACARALFFGNLSYGGLKKILRHGLDLQAEPVPTPRLWLSEARHSRKPTELLETRHGNHG